MAADITFLDMLRAWKQLEPPDELRELISHGQPGARHVMTVVYILLGYWNRNGRRAWPSLGRLRRKHSWSKNTVCAAVAIAERVGLLQVHKRTGQTNAYSFPAIEAAARVLACKPLPQTTPDPRAPIAQKAEHLTPEQVAERKEQSRRDCEAYKREHGVRRLGDLVAAHTGDDQDAGQ